MQKELLELVQKNLPEMAAKEFATYFAQAEHTKSALKEAEDVVANFERVHKEDTKTIDRISIENEKLRSENLDWTSRLSDIEQREKKADVDGLKQQLEAEKRVTGTYESLVTKLLTNTIIREQITKNVVVGGGEYQNYNNGVYTPTKNPDTLQTVTDSVAKTTE